MRRSPSKRRRRSGPSGGDAAAPGEGTTPAEAAADRAARALWLTLTVLVAARAAFTFVPSMWGWSLNLQRFMAPASGWGLWALSALALLPALARRAAPLGAAAGETIARGPAWTLPLGCAGAAALVWLLPDRVWFVGDFLLRQMTLDDHPTMISHWYPYSLPLDLFLHDTVGRYLMKHHGLLANDAGRLLGACGAASLAALAVAFARVLRLRGAASVAAAAIVFWGGYLTMSTGYNKAFAEMPLVVAAAGATGVALARDGGRPLWFGAVLATGFVLHRSALGLLPVAAVVAWLWMRDHPGAWRRPLGLAALALPAATLAIMLPRIVRIVTQIDPMHFTPDEVRAAGGVLPGLILGTRLVDLANLVPMLSPVAPAVPFMAAALGGALPWRAEGLVLAALAVPFVATMPFIHPGQGYYRDWDDFAAAGMAMSLLTAWMVARVIERRPRWAWLSVSVVVGAMVPSLQWLIHESDTNRGLWRVETFLRESPPRSPSELARAWDYLAARKTDLSRYDEAVEAYSRLAAVQPSPRVMRQWATATVLRGDPRGAQRIYRQMLTRFPGVAAGWRELAQLSYRMGDLDEARRAAGELLRLRPDDDGARGLVDHLDSLRGLHAE
jgi:hypothetical protein